MCRSENIFSTTFCVQTKEYISLLERTAPPPLRLPEKGLSQPLSACTDGSYIDGQVVHKCSILQTERGEVGRVLPTEDEGGGGGAVCSKIDIQ